MLWLDAFPNHPLIGIRSSVDIRSNNYYIDALHPWIQKRSKFAGNELTFVHSEGNLALVCRDREFELGVDHSNLTLKYLGQEKQKLEDKVAFVIQELDQTWSLLKREVNRVGFLVVLSIENDDFPPSLRERMETHVALWPGDPVRNSFQMTKDLGKGRKYNVKYEQKPSQSQFSLDFQINLEKPESHKSLKRLLENLTKESCDFFTHLGEA